MYTKAPMGAPTEENARNKRLKVDAEQKLASANQNAASSKRARKSALTSREVSVAASVAATALVERVAWAEAVAELAKDHVGVAGNVARGDREGDWAGVRSRGAGLQPEA